MNRKKQIIDEIAPNWDVQHDRMLECPCGYRVEDDGQCPNGHISPLRQNGMI